MVLSALCRQRWRWYFRLFGCLQASDAALWSGGWGGACLNIKLQAASEHTASSSEQTARRHGNAAPVGRSLSVVLKASRAQEGRKEAEGEGCRSCDCCRQRKSAVSTCSDAFNSPKHQRHIFPFRVISLLSCAAVYIGQDWLENEIFNHSGTCPGWIKVKWKIKIPPLCFIYKNKGVYLELRQYLLKKHIKYPS